MASSIRLQFDELGDIKKLLLGNSPETAEVVTQTSSRPSVDGDGESSNGVVGLRPTPSANVGQETLKETSRESRRLTGKRVKANWKKIAQQTSVSCAPNVLTAGVPCETNARQGKPTKSGRL